MVSTAIHPDASRVIIDKARSQRTKLLLLKRDFTIHQVKNIKPSRPSQMTLHSFEIKAPPESHGTVYKTAMAGIHQAENAASAVMAAKVLSEKGFQIDKQAIASGLRKTRLPARIEWISDSPPIVLDAAHNVASMESLVKTLSDQRSLPKKRVLVFAASADKQLAEMLRASKAYFTDIVLTRYATNPRAATITRLRKAAAEGGWRDSHVAASPAEAVTVAKQLSGGKGLLCIAGSFFLAAEVRAALTSLIDS